MNEIQPGDLVVDAIGNGNTPHVVIFEKWNDSAHRSYTAYEQRGSHGTSHRSYTAYEQRGSHGTSHRSLTYGLAAGSEFKAYRPLQYAD
ncbi:hypothetical protein ACFWDQ_14620 [Streptomyces sp. NPDC060053]|uniref:hypothetical protein n=1 Tax=Streptomyces sp. NPDC060053 TaxID=3347047 RepID=UPI0036932DBD